MSRYIAFPVRSHNASSTTSHAASPIVKDGKRMWNEMVKANWTRDSNSGSSSGIPASTRETAPTARRFSKLKSSAVRGRGEEPDSIGADGFERFERAGARGGMLDDGRGIGAAQGDVRLGERPRRRFPRRVNCGRGQKLQFRHPCTHIIAARIELLALKHGIKDAEIRCSVGARTRNPLPVRRIVGEIGINQGVEEPISAGLPGQQQMLDEK